MRTWKGGVRTVISHVTPSLLSLLALVCGAGVTPDLLCKPPPQKRKWRTQWYSVGFLTPKKDSIVVSEETLAGMESASGNAWCYVFVWSFGSSPACCLQMERR